MNSVIDKLAHEELARESSWVLVNEYGPVGLYTREGKCFYAVRCGYGVYVTVGASGPEPSAFEVAVAKDQLIQVLAKAAFCLRFGCQEDGYSDANLSIYERIVQIEGAK